MKALPITVTNTSISDSLQPVCGGVPLAEGEAPAACGFELKDASGRPVACQTDVIARWKDGSARWVLLDFLARPKPGEVLTYTLCSVAQPDDDAPGTGEFVSGGCDVMVVEDGSLRIAGCADIALTLVDENGAQCRTVVESADDTSRGPVRRTLEITGAFHDGEERRLFSWRMRASVFSGLSRMLLEPMVIIDPPHDSMQRFRELRLDVRLVGNARSGRIGGSERVADADGSLRLFQIDDRKLTVQGTEQEGQAPGWAEVETDTGDIALALRDFWQQWPKSLECGGGVLSLGLLPAFDEGQFAHMEPWYKYDYLWQQNLYRLRCGQARRWQVWLDMEGDGEELARCADAPLVPSADPSRALATGVWGEAAPAGSPGMQEYDTWAERLFDGYVTTFLESRDTGAMNWGDWFGERKCNWGNHEYDTPRQMLLQFARTGDPKYHHLGSTAARHTAEVDVIHHVNDGLRSYFLDEVCKAYTNRSIIDSCPIRPGMMHAHCVGHVGGFHSVDTVRSLFVSFTPDSTGNPYLCLDPYNVGHVFAQGMAYCYFLTGDEWIRETLLKIGDNLASLVEERKLCFTGRPCAGRELGWPMLALAAIYELDFDERYLNAMRMLAEDALAEQDANCGGWLQEMFGGHCNCEKRKHVGEASFITSIRLNGLYRYWRLSGDERIPEAIRRGIDNLNEDRWRECRSGWRYTSCPASPFGGQPGVTMMAMAGVVRMLGDAEHARILRKAWEALRERYRPAKGTNAGKSFASTIYGSAEAAAALADYDGLSARKDTDGY